MTDKIREALDRVGWMDQSGREPFSSLFDAVKLITDGLASLERRIGALEAQDSDLDAKIAYLEAKAGTDDDEGQ